MTPPSKHDESTMAFCRHHYYSSNDHPDQDQSPVDLIASRSRRLQPRRLPAAPSNLAVTSDRPLSNSSHQPPSTRSPRLERSLLIAAHWTVRATRLKFPTPPIESSIAAMLHLAPCPSPDTPMRALRGVEHIHHTFHDLLL